MSEHSELLKEARSQANELVGCVVQVYLSPKRSMCKAYITTLRALADLVEAYAKSQPELVAACKTCDEAIVDVLRNLTIASSLGTTGKTDAARPTFMKLHAARHRVRRAVELAEPQGDAVSEQPRLPRKERYAAVIALLDKWVADDSGYDEETWMKLKASLAEPPPVEVEMRCEEHYDGGWTWECHMGGSWIVQLTRSYGAQENAISGGNCWLAALREQLGVPLQAKWEDGE